MSEKSLGTGVDRLVASGLIFCRGLPPELLYLFKHSLVQDVAYGTLLRRKREELHSRIANAWRRNSPIRRHGDLLHITSLKLACTIELAAIGSGQENWRRNGRPTWK